MLRVITRLVALTAVAIVTGGAQYSCSSGTDDPKNPLVPPPRDIASGEGPTFTTTLVLMDSAGAQKSSFERGELIVFELTVRNRTAESVTVDLSSTPRSDFFVFPNGADEPVWYGLQGLAFPAVITHLVFAPNETKVFSRTWNQEIPGGAFLARGNYEARGAVMAVGVLPTFLSEHELASTLRAFSVN